MTSSFVHLHCHSEYSILDGACRIRELVARAIELEMPAVTITDHGSMAGAIELYRAATASGVKPILGCEVYHVDDRFRREAGRERSWAHLTLLAESAEGYHNLIKIVTASYLDGYHYKPRADYDLIARHANGLIALSGCLSGRVCRSLLDDNYDHARVELERLVDVFGREAVYVEIQDAGIPAHRRVNPALIRLADDAALPMVATGDVHYLRREDADPHEALLCIQTGDELANPNRFRFENKEFYFKTPAEMQRDFAAYERELLRPSLDIAERCNVKLDLGGIRLPRFDAAGDDANGYLERVCREGLSERYPLVTDELNERLRFELATIREMGFADYFLIVWDFVAFAKRNGISVGPGRGSAAGSLVAYCTGITDIDPIRHELLFERFLNPGRKSMPDIDIDFSVHGRERVLNYVVDKYGRERVAQIITFGKLAAKAATRDTGRVLGLPFAVVDRIAKLIPEGPKVSFDDCLKPGQELRAAYDDPSPIGHDPSGAVVTTQRLVDIARSLEGLVRQDSIHAAAVVIGDSDLSAYLPLQRKGADAELVTQYAMGDVEALGLLKMDFLGLRNLDVVDEAVRLVNESGDLQVDITQVPLDDPATYQLLSRGDATGVFQFESTGMRDALRQVRPTEFDDLVALVALYRPGPMANIPVYARRKNGHEPVAYADARLEPIVSATYGVYIYQEQAMQIAKTLAGFSPAEADDLRKAIAKKNPVLMGSLKQRFLTGCQAQGVAVPVAEAAWTENERSADYSFNKSHAACYALIAYRTAYLKANWPAQYMAALISSVMDTKDKVPFYVAECVEMGIDVLPPDVNESARDFAVVNGKIRFGLSAVKNVGDNAVRAVLKTRAEDGAFRSLWDFCERVEHTQISSRVLESLIRAGAFDSTGAARKGLLLVAEQALAAGRKSQADRLAGQGSFFDLDPVSDGGARGSWPAVPSDEFDRRELLAGERETLGVYVSSHPLADIRDQLRRKVDVSLRELGGRREGERVAVGGLITAVRPHVTRKGESMAFVTLEDMTGSAEVTVFARTYAASRALLNQDQLVVIRGRIDSRGGESKMVADEVVAFEAVAEVGVVHLAIDARRLAATAIEDLKLLVREFPGEHPVVIELATSHGPKRLRLGAAFRVRPESAFFAEVRARLGDATLV